MKLFPRSLIILYLGVECICIPVLRCWHQSYNFVDAFALRREIPPCKSYEKITRNLCISCKPKVFNTSQNSTTYSNELQISQPQILCLDIDMKNGTNSGHIVLSWTWSETVTSPFIFMIESRNYSMQLGNWDVVGVTTVTFADITNLDLRLQYQFRVTPITKGSSALLPMTSNWTKPIDSTFSVSPPTNIYASEFQVKNGLVSAKVKWTASEEKPCSYTLFWFSSIGSSYHQHEAIVLPHTDLSIVLLDLKFETNYTITIMPNGLSQKSVSVKTWFSTPSCLDLTGGNFSICAPGCPQNVSVYWNDNNEAILSWMPPTFTSPENPVSNYHISVVESVDNFQSPLQYITSHIAKQDNLNFTFQHLNPAKLYVFEVRAISKRGTGNPAVVELDVQVLEQAVLSKPTYSLPYYDVMLGVGVSLAIIGVAAIVVIVIILYRKRMYRNKGAPTGLADVDDYIRPYLVPVNKIELEEVVGKGAFGIVHRGILTRNKCREEVAVKVFPSETVTRQQLLHEVELMSIIGRHHQIVDFQGFSLDVDKMFLIFEYCLLGDLHSYLVNLEPELTRINNLPPVERKFSKLVYSPLEIGSKYGRQLCSYIYQVALGMEYIASLKLIHRDLAARNILMHSETRVKIGDFGLSKDVYETKIYSGSFKKKMPIKWMAPEAIEKQKFTTYSDVWSFGILMWEVFKLGEEPYLEWLDSNILQFLKRGYRLKKPHCPQKIYNLMCLCWKKNPKERPQFREIVRKVGALIEEMWYCLPLSIINGK